MGESVEREGGEGRFIGIIKPVLGQWNWPFGQMLPGDWFLVDQEDRDPELFRKMVSVRSSQLKKGFQVTKHDPDHPGYVKVTCSEYLAGRAEPSPSTAKVLEYHVARHRLMDWFAVNIDKLPLGQLDTKLEEEVTAPMVDEHAPERCVFRQDRKTYGMEREGSLLRFVALPDGWTLKVWMKLYEQWQNERGAELERKRDERMVLEHLKAKSEVPSKFADAAAKADMRELKTKGKYEALVEQLKLEAIMA